VNISRRSANVFDRLCWPGLICLRFLVHLHSPTGHYDEPEILSYAIQLVCSIGADVKQNPVEVAIDIELKQN